MTLQRGAFRELVDSELRFACLGKQCCDIALGVLHSSRRVSAAAASVPLAARRA